MEKRRFPARDNRYYETLLKKKNPHLYRQWISGNFPTLKRALVAAKIKQEPSRFQLLVRHWNKATAQEKQAFRKLIEQELSRSELLVRHWNKATDQEKQDFRKLIEPGRPRRRTVIYVNRGS